jgi:membrane-associated phospholipid phosphatase
MRAHEVLLVTGLAALAGLACFGPHAAWIVPLHAALAGAILLLARFDRPGALRLARNIGPVLAAVPLMYYETALIVPWVNGFEDHRFDGWLAAAERAAFGDVAAAAGSMPPFLADLLTLGYWSYYVWPALLVARLYRRPDAFREAITVIPLVYLLSFVGYYFVPARGPYLFEARPEALDGALWAGAAHAAMAKMHGLNPDAFPSGHAMVSISLFVLYYRHERAVFWWGLPVELLLLNATWALRYHYICDVLAGAAAAPLAVWGGLALARGRRQLFFSSVLGGSEAGLASAGGSAGAGGGGAGAGSR